MDYVPDEQDLIPDLRQTVGGNRLFTAHPQRSGGNLNGGEYTGPMNMCKEVLIKTE